MTDEVKVKLASLEDLVALHTKELRVSGATLTNQLGTAILKFIEEGKRPVLSCIGAQAVTQACKSVANANGEGAQQGFIHGLIPTFEKKTFENARPGTPTEMTAMRLIVIRVPLLAMY